MKKISPCLWFHKDGEKAAELYVSVFPNSKIVSIVHSSADTPSGPKGMVLTVNFELDGNEFVALNGGEYFTITEAVSFIVPCKDQEEIDYYWEKLSAVPESEQCGWLKDKFGVSWQIVPENMDELIKTEAAIKAMLNMKKIDIVALKAAA